jgi:hypothetical protein
VADEQHVAEPGDEIVGVEWLAAEPRLDRDLDAERFACQLGGLERAALRTREARIDVRAEQRKRATGGLGLRDAAFGQRPVIVGEAVGGLCVAEQPEHSLELYDACANRV